MADSKISSEALQNLLSDLKNLNKGNFSQKAKISENELLNLVNAEVNQLAAELERCKNQAAQYRKLIDSVPDMLGYWDADLKNVHANKAYADLGGRTPEDLKGIYLPDLVGRELFDKNKHNVEAVLKGIPQIFDREITFLDERGMRLCISKYIPDIIDEKVVGFFSIVTDITDFRKMDQQYKVVVETMDEGFVVQNDKGEILQFNQAALDILGLTEDQLAGKTSFDPDWKAIKEDGSDFLGEEHPAIVALKTGKNVNGVIMGVHLPGGKRNWISINAKPYYFSNKLEMLSHGLDSKIQKVVCTFTDITVIKEREAELKFILDTLKIGVWKFNPCDQSLIWDKMMFDIFDVEDKNIGIDYKTWENCLEPNSKEKTVAELVKVINGENDFNSIFEIQTKKRGNRYISGRGKLINNPAGEGHIMYGINIDCTEEVLKEQQIEKLANESRRNAKLASLGELSAGIAHEINNPLAIIEGSLELLVRFKDNPEKFTAKVESIKKATHRITRIVQSLKKFSRSDSKTVYRPFPIKEILNDALILTEANVKKCDVRIEIESRCMGVIHCNEIEVEQVIVNLINNALDAIKTKIDKWIKISIYEEANQVVLRVMDSGKGIPEEVRQNLFDPFFTTKQTGEGTGLGLSISKGIIDEHKATITVLDNCPNTCFEIRFPQIKEGYDAY
jgi:PAS domain S-box-containing protein